MSHSSLAELTGASYRLVASVLASGKGARAGPKGAAFVKSLERSLPSHYWDLSADHAALLLYAATRSSSRAAPVVRSLCARLSNICEDAARGAHETHAVPSARSPVLDLENLAVVTWCLDRLLRRGCDDVQLTKMAANLSALLLDWAERGSECLSQRSAPLREQLPPDHYAKLCTSFLCLGRVLGGLPPVGGAAFPEGAPELYGAFARLVEVVLDACLCEAESRRSPSPAQRGGPSFEKVHEAYIACSLTVLDALVRHRYPVDAAAAAYSKLLGELDFNRIENAEVLVRTFSLLVAEKIPGDVGKATVRRLLDEIGARDLYDLPAELLCEVVRGCSVSSTQHVAALDAVCDAFLERSHQLPDLQTVVDLLASFRVLSYHNAAVLEMLVRHVHNNAESATAAQVSSVLESCGALQFNHPTLDELAREKPCP